MKAKRYTEVPPVGRYHGSVVLVAAILAALISSGVAFSLAKLHTATMKTLETSKVNIEAQQYGLAKAEYLRSTTYDALASQGKQSIVSSDGFKDEVIVGSEEAYNDKLNQKVCTINVYKDDEKLPRFSYKVSKLSSSSDSSSVPKGTILPWYGSSDSVPKGYALCNGQNGTPDLRGRFLVGVDGSTYKLGSKGGEEKVILKKTNLPSDAKISVSGYIAKDYGGGVGPYSKYGMVWSGSTSGDDDNCYIKFGSFSGTIFSGWNSSPCENRPPYFAVQYIMKL